MPIVADAAVAIRGDLSKFTSDLRPAEASVASLGTKLKAALSPPGVGGISGDFTNLATALDRAQREADEALTALRALSRADLPEEDARKYADAINDIESEAKVTVSELRQLQSAQPQFDTPELRQAADGLDRVGDEANQLGNEFRELARQNPEATLSKAARESKSLAAGMDKANHASKGLVDRLFNVRSVIFSLGLGISATQIFSFFSDATKAASDLGETTSKASQIFGKEAIPALESWAATAATTFGQSKQQALDGAATFAIFGKSAGLAGDDLVGFSTDLVELSGDLASFANTSPEEAITAIGAALRGESEPIRRYGILLDEATLRQAAFKMGIIDNIKTALTPQQRVLAAQAEIFRQTSDAQGDFARTSEGLANQQRIQAARMQDAMVELGNVLLPLALQFTEFAVDAIPGVINALKMLVQIVGPVGEVLADQAYIIVPALAAVLGIKLVGALKAAAVQARLTGLSMKGMLGPLGLLAIGAELGEAAATGLADKIYEIRRGAKGPEIKALAKQLEFLNSAWEPWKAEGMADELTKVGISAQDFAKLVEQAGGDGAAAFDALVASHFDLGKAIDLIGPKAGALGIAFGRDIPAGAAAADRAVGGLAAVMDTLSPAMKRAVDEVLATATEVPEGLSVTLEDGTVLVAGSAEELAAVLPDAIRVARQTAVFEAAKAPGEIADAILAGKDELAPIHDAIVDALVNGVSDARVRATNEALLFGPALRKGLRKSGFTETQAKELLNTEALVESVLAVEPDLFDVGKKLPPAIAKGYRNTRQSVIQAVRDINNDQTLTAGEVAQFLEIKGQDGLAALVRGMRSKKQDVVDAQDDLNQAAIDKAGNLGPSLFDEGSTGGERYGDGIGSRGNVNHAGTAAGSLRDSAKANLLLGEIGYTAGKNLATGVASGIRDYTYVAGDATAVFARYIGKQLPINSPPEDPSSPLANIYKVGGNIVEAITSGIYNDLRQAQRASTTLAAALRPNIGIPALALSGAGGPQAIGSAGAGNTYNVTTSSTPREKSTLEIAHELRRAEYLGILSDV